MLLAALCLAVLLSGCVRTELGVTLNKDGTGVITTPVAVEEDVYNMMKQSGSDPFEGRETQNVTYDDTEYVSCSEATERLPYEDLETRLKVFRLDNQDETGPLLFQDVSIEKNSGLFYSSFFFKAKTAAQVSTDESGQEVDETFKFFVTVTMPGNITQVKGGVVEGNTVTFEIEDLTQENELAVYADSNNIGVIIGIIVALVVILGAAFIILRKRG